MTEWNGAVVDVGHVMEVVLYQPEIPPNTGNIARLCAATEIPLHLIRPLGFTLDDRRLRRAGLDYWPHVRITVWDRFEEYLAARRSYRKIGTSARAGGNLFDFRFQSGDCLLFGPETRGLPPELLASCCDHVVRIPIASQVRSLNLSSAVAVVLFEALRQTRYTGGEAESTP